MSQRNPMNERYTSEERTGKTRKSAASAKPSSKAASSVRVEGQSSEKPKGLFSRAQKAANKNQSSKDKGRQQNKKNFVYDVPTEEYRWWRRMWWIMIIAAVVLTALSLFAMNAGGGNYGYVPLVFGYGFLIASIVIDIRKVRKIREDYNNGRFTDRSKEATRSRKERKAAEKEAAAEQEAVEQEKAAKREAKNAERNAKLTAFFNRSGSKGGKTDAAEAGESADASDAADAGESSSESGKSGKSAAGK